MTQPYKASLSLFINKKNQIRTGLPVTSPFLHERSLQHQLVYKLLLIALQKVPPVQRLQSGEDSTELTRKSRCSPLEVKELGAFGEELGLESGILERMSELCLFFPLLLLLQPMEKNWWYCEHDLSTSCQGGRWPALLEKHLVEEEDYLHCWPVQWPATKTRYKLDSLSLLLLCCQLFYKSNSAQILESAIEAEFWIFQGIRSSNKFLFSSCLVLRSPLSL